MRFIKLIQFFAVLFLSMFLVVSAVHAVSTGQSKVSVEFQEDTSPPDILDPDDPTKPYDPGPGDPIDDGTGNTGPLTLDYVSSLDFGNQKISLVDQKYETTILRPFIQVTDRRIEPTGWIVQLKSTEIANESDPTEILNGATISFKNSECISNLGDKYTAPIPEDFILTTDEAIFNVVSAIEGAGRGTWITKWCAVSREEMTNENITLTVPGGTAKPGKYSATLTWVLSNAP